MRIRFVPNFCKELIEMTKELYAPGWFSYLLGFKRQSYCKDCLRTVVISDKYYDKNDCMFCEDYGKEYVDTDTNLFKLLFLMPMKLIIFIAGPILYGILFLIGFIFSFRISK